MKEEEKKKEMANRKSQTIIVVVMPNGEVELEPCVHEMQLKEDSK